MRRWIFLLVFLAAMVSDFSLNGSLLELETGIAMTEGMHENAGEEQDETGPVQRECLTHDFILHQRPSLDCLSPFYAHHAMDVSGPPPESKLVS